MTARLDMDQFLASVQNRAFITARVATSHDDEAMDIVQDAMLKMVKAYYLTPKIEWPGLFQRVLQNTIRDWYRRQTVRKVLFWWQQTDTSEEQLQAECTMAPSPTPAALVEQGQINRHIEQAVHRLPVRQQQAFMLRAYWEHSTEETAEIMGCSTGSVKTHYSRALSALQITLAGQVAEQEPA